MTSVFIYSGLASAVFLLIFGLRLKRCPADYSLIDLAAFYGLMRLVPLFMLTERSVGNYAVLLIDAAFLAGMFFTAREVFGNRAARTTAALYLFSPLTVICVVTGGALQTVFLALMCVLTLGSAAVLKARIDGFSPQYFYREYVLLSLSIWLGGFAADCIGSRVGEIIFTVSSPTVLVLCVVFSGITIVLTADKLLSLFKNPPPEAEPVQTHGELSTPNPDAKFGIKNTAAMLALTLVYAAAVLTNLGSTKAPQENACLNSGTTLLLDFGEDVRLSEMSVFLGRLDNRYVSISAYSEKTRQWTEISEYHNIPSVFAWNTTEINCTGRFVKLEFFDDSYLNEIVFLDENGNRILPVNSADRAELFDEQELFPCPETSFYSSMFDEIYYARTAVEFLGDLPIYETTHPPLGKSIIAIGVSLFGVTPFGWRIMPAIFGILMVPAAYLFAWVLSKRSDIAFLGGLLTAAEFMHFTLSRIATLDIIVGLFIQLMFLFMFCFAAETERGGSTKKQALWLVLCGIVSALAIATKWTGVYAGVGIAVIFFTALSRRLSAMPKNRERAVYLARLGTVCVFSFIILPIAAYCLSYTEFAQSYPEKGIIQHAVENSLQSYQYHSSLTAEHPYSSEWYEWLVDKRPLLDWLNGDGETTSSVATLGSPLVVWGGIAALLHNIWLWRCRKNTAAQYLVIAYLSMLMPWLFVHRTVFIYQYFGCIIILVMLICNSLLHLGKHAKKAEIFAAAAAIALFVMFYPLLSGAVVPAHYHDMWLEWLETWCFE